MSNKKTYAVIGLGRYGEAVARELNDNGAEVIAVDINQELVDDAADYLPVCKCADITDPDVIKQSGISNVDTAIIAMASNLESTVMAIMLCKEAGVETVIVKCANETHKKIYSKVGADKVVMTEREAGMRLANSLVSESIVDYLELSEEYSVSELNIPLRWVGHSLDDLKVRNTYDISVMAIRRGGAIIIRIDPYAPLQSGDVLVVIGGNDDIQKIANLR